MTTVTPLVMHWSYCSFALILGVTYHHLTHEAQGYMRNWYGSSLVQAKACRPLESPKSIMTYCLLNKFKWTLNQNENFVFQENVSETSAQSLSFCCNLNVLNELWLRVGSFHDCDAVMSAMASQITGASIVYITVCWGAEQRKYRNSAPLAFVRGIHRWPVNSPHKGSLTRKIFPSSYRIKNVPVYAMPLTWCVRTASFCDKYINTIPR